ncbi:MAG: GNAT family N-acetyltransferase [Rhodobacteraceae bacterium]|nr:GNAT family N-acetyltransferase [Paracoccaceae bacterium]
MSNISENTPVTIEPIDPRDATVTQMVKALDDLMEELYPAESNHLTPLEELGTGANRFFVAKVDGEKLGCGAILVGKDTYAEVKRIYVDPSVRGKGLAKAILNRLERECRLLGLASMKLETGIHQPDGIALFERFGFRQCEAFGRYPADDAYSYFMTKTL